MTDDKTRQAGTPSADPIQEGAGQEPAALEPPINDMDMRYKIMTKKWGSECVEDFIKKCPRVYEMIMRDLSAALTNVFKDMEKPMHEHTVHVIMRVTRRMIEIDISRALIAHLINHIQGINETVENFYTEYHDVFLHIEKEIEKRPEAPGHTGLKVQEIDVFFDQIGAEDAAAVIGGTFETVCSQILRDAAANARKDREAGAERENMPVVTYTNKPGIELTTDKLMTVFFGANAPAPRGQIPGQMTFIPVKYEKTGAPEITLYYTYDFDNDLFTRLKLEKKIDDEDYFILSFIAGYWRAGEKVVSVAKLYKDMTGENPNNRQLTTLTNRLMKIAGTNIFINDREVRKAWGIEDEKKTYKEILTPLAPIKVGTERFVTRGQVVEAGIEILAEPDIVKLGYEMGQFTTVPKNLLHVKKKNGRGLSRTPRFYRVLHFLIRRIASIKSGRLSAKILYETFYSEIGETTARGKRLALDCMYTILDHFKDCDHWITGYREETTATTGQVGVRIFSENTTKSIVTTKK